MTSVGAQEDQTVKTKLAVMQCAQEQACQGEFVMLVVARRMHAGSMHAKHIISVYASSQS